MRKTALRLLCLTSLCFPAVMLPSVASAMTVSEAYASIPHRQTPYDPQISPIPTPDSEYLSRLFTLTDEAMRLRVEALRQLYHNFDYTYIDEYNVIYAEIIQQLRTLPSSGTAKQAQNLILEAIHEQKNFLNEWANARQEDLRIYRDYAKHKDVKSSHRKLLKAFGILMDTYPQESPENKKAFFDHLCALDFI